ncbi:helix-turn-helix domain-containing protein, partial [Candidatus Skiveiella danica]|uniref:helix-turn-helix domain-containing protein n=1 Tax=Candidatus Skiveiella danica TaxID=3386177 RepID=UPI0039B88D2F
VLEAPSATTDPLLATSPVAESAAEPLPAVAAPVPVAGVSAVAHRPVAVPPGSPSPLAAYPLVDGADATAWEQALEREAQGLLAAGQNDVLAHRFESRLIRTALAATHGRRMEAAQRLGIGRNTITRKIQELGLDGVDEAKNGYGA